MSATAPISAALSESDLAETTTAAATDDTPPSDILAGGTTAAHTTQTLAPTEPGFRHDPQESPLGAASLATTGLALSGVIALILLLAWLVKRLEAGAGVHGTRVPLRALARLPLGHKQNLVVVEVGHQRLMLGVGPQGVSHLGDLDEQALPENLDCQSGGESGSDAARKQGFAALLQSRLTNKAVER